MVGEIEIKGTDLDKPAYKAYYPLAKHVYQDNGEIVPENIASDKQILLILCAKIMAKSIIPNSCQSLKKISMNFLKRKK